MGTWKTALRWLAVVPAALIAGILILFPLHWIAQIYQLLPGYGDPMLTDGSGQSIFKTMRLEDLERMGQALLVPATIILVASRVAPKAHFTVAIVAAVALVATLASSYWLLSSRTDIQLTFGAIPAWVMVALWVASIAGALFKTYTDWSEAKA